MKYIHERKALAHFWSPFSRGRGLKYGAEERGFIYADVALFTRAWIEIPETSILLKFSFVALFTRAWIEIIGETVKIKNTLVALFTRAWIEINLM